VIEHKICELLLQVHQKRLKSSPKQVKSLILMAICRKSITHANFIERRNRFVAHVELDGKVETVHVQNSGRCKELLLPGSDVMLAKADKSSPLISSLNLGININQR